MKESKGFKRKSTKKGASKRSSMKMSSNPAKRNIDFKKATLAQINEHIGSLDLDPLSESDLQAELG